MTLYGWFSHRASEQLSRPRLQHVLLGTPFDTDSHLRPTAVLPQIKSVLAVVTHPPEIWLSTNGAEVLVSDITDQATNLDPEAVFVGELVNFVRFSVPPTLDSSSAAIQRFQQSQHP
ncbi:MAG: hypothetical protein E6R03_01600 [Hyphomicrobiaceae bacterium]|nr:MAG: hypothetical protein E6R03_01600 [Hyphomicrobiaceae bacterium]